MCALATTATLLAGCGKSQQNVDNAAPSVETAPVRYGDFNIVLNESGRIGAPAGATSQLAFAAPGILGTVYVHVGQHVAAGEALATLDSRSLGIAVSQAAADARAAGAQAEAAAVDRYSVRLRVDRASLEREQRLYQAGIAAAKDVETARAQLAADAADARGAAAGRSAAEAQAQSAAARAQLASTDLARATLRSPVDGIVTAITRRPGEAVDPTIAVVGIGAASQSEATLTVSAADAAQMSAGDLAEIHAANGATSRGRVTGVSSALDPTTQAATVTVSGVPDAAVAGSDVTARISVGRVRGLLVPQTAIVTDPQSGDTVVFVMQKQKDGSTKFELRKVVVAHEDGTTAQLASGVRVGERVASQGAFELLAPAND